MKYFGLEAFSSPRERGKLPSWSSRRIPMCYYRWRGQPERCGCARPSPEQPSQQAGALPSIPTVKNRALAQSQPSISDSFLFQSTHTRVHRHARTCDAAAASPSLQSQLRSQLQQQSWAAVKPADRHSGGGAAVRGGSSFTRLYRPTKPHQRTLEMASSAKAAFPRLRGCKNTQNA